MADLERIAPPVPTLPTPIGRNVGSKRRRPLGSEPQRRSTTEAVAGSSQPHNPESDHIDEYV
jgi:hypothetical protein